MKTILLHEASMQIIHIHEGGLFWGGHTAKIGLSS